MADENAAPVENANDAPETQVGDAATGEVAPTGLPQKVKVVIHGKEEMWELDRAIRMAQMGEAGQRSLQEAARLRKETAAVEEEFGKDPVAVMVKKFGAEKAKAMLEDRLYQMYKQAQETPEQKQARLDKEELHRLKSDKERLEKEREDEKHKQLEDQFAAKWNREFTDAIKTVGLPHNARNVQRMAQLGAMALDNNLDVDAVELAKMVRDERRDYAVKTVQDMTPEELYEILGEKMNDLRNVKLGKLKSPAMARRPGTAPKVSKRLSSEEEKLTAEEKFERYKASLRD